MRYTRPVIRYRFGQDDLLRTRFAVSPLFEIVWSAHVLRRPARAPLHPPWIADARECLAGLDWSLLDWVANGHGEFGFVPDFITPPPATPLADLDGELERVRATPPEQVAREVSWRFEGEEIPAVVRPLLDDPASGLDRLVDVMRAYWERAIEPWWPELRAVLEDDIVHRARRLTAGGTIEVFAGLHRGVRWRDGAVEVEHRVDADVDLRGRGLLLVPTVFAWPEVFAMIDEPWQPALIYTPRGAGELSGRRRRRTTPAPSTRSSAAAAPRSCARCGRRRRPRTSRSGSPRPRPQASPSTSASCGAQGSCAPSATAAVCSTCGPRRASRCCAHGADSARVALADPVEEHDARHHQAADAEGEELAEGVRCARTSQPKFWPKNPVTKVSGRNTVARIVSCSMVSFWRTPILVCSTEITAMFASSRSSSRSRWAETSSLTSSRWSCTSRTYGASCGVDVEAPALDAATGASSGWTAR